MPLADLIDLEARIVARAREQHDQLAARDRRVAERLDVDDRDRGALLSAWLAALRAEEPDGPVLRREAKVRLGIISPSPKKGP